MHHRFSPRRPAAEALEPRTMLAVFVVTTTADSGPGSLRQAILDSNANGTQAADVIQFDIAGPGVHTIAPASPLPTLTSQVTIDGTTQPGYAGAPQIELDGSGAGAAADGLVLAGPEVPASMVRGLAVGRFGGNGVVLSSIGAHLEGSYVGVGADGDTARPNGTGVRVTASYTVIGGATPGQRNLISGNNGPGVRLGDGVSRLSFVKIIGNYVGVDGTGRTGLGNGFEGILLDNGGNTNIGGTAPGEGNVISANGASGIRATGNSNGIRINGNLIGTDASGRQPLGNGQSASAEYRDGITILRSPSDNGDVRIGDGFYSGRNIISANRGAGVSAPESHNIQLNWNFIGTDSTGAVDLGNAGDGVFISGGGLGVSASLRRNLISGNGGDGLRIVGRGRVAIDSNFIGTDLSGTAALANAGNGMNLLNVEGSVGVSRVVGPPPNLDVEAGGRGNLVSGNGGAGIVFRWTPDLLALSGERVPIESNYVGTDVSGTRRIGNGGAGIDIESARVSLGTVFSWAGNVVSANGGDGIIVANYLSRTVYPTLVQSNRVGTDTTGTVDLGNGGNGITVINSTRVIVGPEEPGVGGNTVAFNAGRGVVVTTTAGGVAYNNRISSNSIHSNGGLEVDLGADGATPNDPGDADVGPNRLLNYPTVTEVMSAPASDLPTRSTVRFTVSAEPQKTYVVEFFSAAQPDSGGRGAAETYLGFAQVTTDAAGNAAGVALVEPVAAGRYVSGIVVDTTTNAPYSASDSSEFGPAVVVTPGEVFGRFVFYNHSAFDRNDPGANEFDDSAIEVRGYSIAGAAPFVGSASMTNYSRGLNGIMIDVARLPEGATLTPNDFEFHTRAGPAGSAWKDAPAPSMINVRRGAGVGGSDRVTLIWPDYSPRNPAGTQQAVANGWLGVTMKPTPSTGLTRADTFYFGNLVGEITTYTSSLRVDAIDLRSLRDYWPSPFVTPIQNTYDFNKDGRVNAIDMGILRSNLFRTLSPLTDVPAPASSLSLRRLADEVLAVN